MNIRIRLLTFAALFVVFAESSTPVLGADTYSVDPTHSTVIFRITHLSVSTFQGRFNNMSGSFTVDSENPAKSSVQIEIEVESLDTNSDRRNNHLRSPDFFNAKQFPKITLESTAVKKKGDERLEVTGNLTLHGVTKSIKVEMVHIGSGKDPWGGFRSGYDTRFTIKRSEFGMDYMMGGLGDEVEILLSIEGIQK